MVIYGEYLFLENFLAGWFLLAVTGKLCGPAGNRRSRPAGAAQRQLQAAEGRSALGRRRMRRRGGRLVLGAAACGLYSFTLFLEPLGFLPGLLLKLTFAWAVTAFCFGTELRFPAVFLLVSLALGGLVTGLLFLCEAPGLTYGGGIYIGPRAYGRVAFAMALACGALWRFAVFLEQKKLLRSRLCRAEVTAFGKRLTLRGFFDTGNLLKDPLTGRPVYLLAPEAAAALLDGRSAEVCFPVSFRTAAGGTGRLDCFLPEEIRIYPEPETGGQGISVRAVLAQAPGSLPKNCDLLLAMDAACIVNGR
ncbi:MAG: hypothetical protein E7223_00170 [Clostridiales bacterium]|nr:hypothetical protein [Clostridiales bacterium]